MGRFPPTAARDVENGKLSAQPDMLSGSLGTLVQNNANRSPAQRFASFVHEPLRARSPSGVDGSPPHNFVSFVQTPPRVGTNEPPLQPLHFMLGSHGGLPARRSFNTSPGPCPSPPRTLIVKKRAEQVEHDTQRTARSPEIGKRIAFTQAGQREHDTQCREISREAQHQVNVSDQLFLKLVVFDFDCTLSAFHVFSSLANSSSTRPRLVVPPPHARTELGQLRRLAELDVDPTWGPGAFALKAFGGELRVEQLRMSLKALVDKGVECIICSRGMVGPMRRCLHQMNLLNFFTHTYANVGNRLGTLGHELDASPSVNVSQNDDYLGTVDMDLGDADKPGLISRCIRERNLNFSQVVFLDDDVDEIKNIAAVCRAIHVPKGGLNDREFEILHAMMKGGHACDVPLTTAVAAPTQKPTTAGSECPSPPPEPSEDTEAPCCGKQTGDAFQVETSTHDSASVSDCASSPWERSVSDFASLPQEPSTVAACTKPLFCRQQTGVHVIPDKKLCPHVDMGPAGSEKRRLALAVAKWMQEGLTNFNTHLLDDALPKPTCCSQQTGVGQCSPNRDPPDAPSPSCVNDAQTKDKRCGPPSQQFARQSLPFVVSARVLPGTSPPSLYRGNASKRGCEIKVSSVGVGQH